MVAYQGCRKRALASSGKGRPKGPGRGERRGNGEKMFFRGNELSYLWQTNDLAFWSVQNELIFECKSAKSNPKKWPKTHLLCGLEPEFASRKTPASGQTRGGLHELRRGGIPLRRLTDRNDTCSPEIRHPTPGTRHQELDACIMAR